MRHLQDLYFLPKEIDFLAEESERTPELADEIEAYRQKRKDELLALEQAVNSIDDHLVRCAVILRGQQCLQWREVAFRLGVPSVDALRTSVSRYLEKHPLP